MFKVYWTLTEAGVESAHSESFDTNDLNGVLKLTENLRAARRNGAPVSFIAFQSEHPDAVGEQGVSDKLPEGYDWVKRRSTLLRKDSESL